MFCDRFELKFRYYTVNNETVKYLFPTKASVLKIYRTKYLGEQAV
jgi:hypothetical protein